MTAVRSRKGLGVFSRLFLHLGGLILDKIIYTTPEDQIKKLRSQNLIILNEENAKNALELFGYSNLIKSYREPYIINSGNKKTYRTGVTFDQLCSLYMLDKNLRNAVMASMLDLEEHIKEAAADVISSSFGTHPDDYLKFKNYANKTKRKHRFSLSGILEKMKNALNSDKDPICHYRTVHKIVPPWILFKSIYFSTIINFIDQLKKDQKEAMVKKLYDISTLNLSMDEAKKLMKDTLSICMEYRNIAAHGGRIYNYICDAKLRASEIFGVDSGPVSCGFGQFLLLLSILDYKNPHDSLNAALSEELNRHCNLYPEDATYLGQILNMDITPTQVVWISNKSNKYHFHPFCSGLKNAYRIEFEKAKEKGYIPCKKCIKQ